MLILSGFLVTLKLDEDGVQEGGGNGLDGMNRAEQGIELERGRRGAARQLVVGLKNYW